MALTEAQKSSIESKKKDIERKKNNIENVKKQKEQIQRDSKFSISKNKELLKNAKESYAKDNFRKIIETNKVFLKNQTDIKNREIDNIKRNIVIIKEEIDRIKSK